MIDFIFLISSPYRALAKLAPVYFVAEVIFSIVYKLYIYPRANRRTEPKEYRDYGRDRHLLLIRIMSRMRRTWCPNDEPFEPEFKNFLRTYFMEDPSYVPNATDNVNVNPDPDPNPNNDPLLKDDVDDFMAWGFFGKKIPELVEWEIKELDKLYDIAEKDFGVTFQPGRTPGIIPCLMNVDEVKALWRPLLVYIFFLALNFSGRFFLFLSGFRFYKTKSGLRYWYRADKTSHERLPLLFFHGIAPGGLAVYLPLLLGGLCGDGRAAFFFENLPVSCSLSFHALTEEETTQGVEEALNRHIGPDAQVTISGHSFGSCQMTWLLHAMPHRIRHMLLLDPVSILICYPDTMKNFAYKRFMKGQRNLDDAKITLLASTEIFIEHYLRRQVSWYNSELWLDDVPDNIQVTVCLSGEDGIVNVAAVKQEVDITNQLRRKIQKYPSSKATSQKHRERLVDLVYWPEKAHGSCLFTMSTWDDMRRRLFRQDFLANKSLKCA